MWFKKCVFYIRKQESDKFGNRKTDPRGQMAAGQRPEWAALTADNRTVRGEAVHTSPSACTRKHLFVSILHTHTVTEQRKVKRRRFVTPQTELERPEGKVCLCLCFSAWVGVMKTFSMSCSFAPWQYVCGIKRPLSVFLSVGPSTSRASQMTPVSSSAALVF